MLWTRVAGARVEDGEAVGRPERQVPVLWNLHCNCFDLVFRAAGVALKCRIFGGTAILDSLQEIK